MNRFAKPGAIKMRRATVTNILAILITAGVALTLAARPAKAGAVWTFYETSCTPVENVPPCMIPPFPIAVGQLALPDINSSGVYSFFNGGSGIPPVEMGDKDFALQIFYGSAPAMDFCMIDTSGCRWDIEFNSSIMALSISIYYSQPGLGEYTDISGGNSGWSGTIYSDGPLPGCSYEAFAYCDVSGYIATSAVPEPSSLGSLASALTGIFLFMLSRRGQDHRRRGHNATATAIKHGSKTALPGASSKIGIGDTATAKRPVTRQAR